MYLCVLRTQYYTLLVLVDGREYDLTAVPRIYFHSSFALENSSTFEEILPIENVLGLGEKESGEGVRQHRMPPTDKLLHEKVRMCIRTYVCTCILTVHCTCIDINCESMFIPMSPYCSLKV